MARLLSPDLPADLHSPSFPIDFPYEVFDSLPSDDFGFEYGNLFLRGISRRLTHSSSSFSGVPTPLSSLPSPDSCVGILSARKLSSSPKSTLGGNGIWSSPADVSQVPFSIHSDRDRFNLVCAAAALELARLKGAPEEPQFGTCRPDRKAPLLSPLIRDPFSLCHAQSTLRRHAREAELVKQCPDALLLAQQRQQQIQAQIRAKKLGFPEGSRFGRTKSFPQPGWASKALPGVAGSRHGSVRGCAGTGVFLPRGYGDLAPESHTISGCTMMPWVIVPAKVVRALNENAQLYGRGVLMPERRNARWIQQYRQHHHHHHIKAGFDF